LADARSGLRGELFLCLLKTCHLHGVLIKAKIEKRLKGHNEKIFYYKYINFNSNAVLFESRRYKLGDRF
jgi:hypothetical protein